MNKTIQEELSDLSAEAMSLGGDIMKKRVSEILKQNIREYQSAHGTGWEYVDIEVIKEIEKL
jgi:hypothetical protein